MIATLTVARYEPDRVRRLLLEVPLRRLQLRRVPGLAWGRHLGTAAGETTLGADAARWAWFCCWDDPAGADRLQDQVRTTAPTELLHLRLRPLRARGAWRGRSIEVAPGASADGGPVAVLTRASVRARRWRSFRSAVPQADAALGRADGRLLSLGMGEWPVLVQGTFSVWRDPAALSAFARRDEDHADVVRRTEAERWYSEELFARFAVVDAEGTWAGRAAGTVGLCPPPPSTRPSAGS